MERNSFKLTVIGIGGVGGLLAGPLLRRYGGAVSLVARGKRRESLLQNGLTLHSDLYGEFTVQSGTVVETPADLPVQDTVLVCVKNGALESVAQQMVPIVGPDTIVLPVMNGVTAGDVLRRNLKTGIVLDSVIYTVSSTGKDFSVTQTGSFTHLFAGAPSGDQKGQESAAWLTGILKDAGIDCRLTENIQREIWNKYVLNCAYNVVTARWGITIGAVKTDPKLMEDCRSLMAEARSVALARGVDLAEDLVDRLLRRIRNTDNSASSSLSRDFAAGHEGEMEVFCGDVLRMAGEKNVPVPVTKAYYEGLRKIASSF